MAIDDDMIRACKTTADFRGPLREIFRAGKYEEVYDAIQRFHRLATANRGLARNKLFADVVAFTSNYVIAPALGAADILDWQEAFPDLLEANGEPREENWTDFLLDRAAFRQDGLREAITVILATCHRHLGR